MQLLNDRKMDKHILEELQKYSSILEVSLHDMADIDFTIEDGKLYILSASVGKRTALANLRIVISMFCEGKMTIDDVIKKLPYQQLEDLLVQDVLVNAHDLKRLGSGLPASSGVGAATACFSYNEAKSLIKKKDRFIYCQIEVSPEDIEIMTSIYCKGVMTSRGGMTSHAAVTCRGIGLPCVSGFGNYEETKNILSHYNNEVTIDGNNGELYIGIGKTKNVYVDLPEIKILFKMKWSKFIRNFAWLKKAI